MEKITAYSVITHEVLEMMSKSESLKDVVYNYLRRAISNTLDEVSIEKILKTEDMGDGKRVQLSITLFYEPNKTIEDES